jgi:uncharacterized membrane protein YadS
MSTRTFSFVVLRVLAVGIVGAMLAPLAYPGTMDTPDNRRILAGSTVTNACAGVLGATVITGELGLS